MARVPSISDFPVDVEGIGRFMFARRNMVDMIRIRGEYNSLTSGSYDEQGNVTDISALGYISIQRLLVSAPANFALDDLDPLTEDDYDDKIMKIYFALREKEASFRPKPAPAKQEAGPGSGSLVRDDVSASVQPAAD